MTRRIVNQHVESAAAGQHNDNASTNWTPPDSGEDALPRAIYSTGFGITVRPKSTTQDDIAEASTRKIFYTIVTSQFLIPGDGEPIPDGALVAERKLIVWVGRKHEIPQQYTSKPHKIHSVPFLMPGLWDCHVHFGGDSGDPYTAALRDLADDPISSGARLAKACWESIQRGYTSVRDVAGYGCEIAKAVEDGSIVGPNIYSSGACLSQLAGHGDVFALPAGDVLSNWGVGSIKGGHFGYTAGIIVDGVDECRRGVRLQIRRGAKCIKILASGGVLSRDDNPLYAQFCKEELDAIVEEATRMHRAVAAHVHGKPGILAAVAAGVTTVEHVTFADQECIDLIKEKGVVYVATRTIVDLLLQSGGKGLPPIVWEKAKLCGANHLNAYKLAIKNGVTLALGTDTEPGFNQAMELDYAVQAGLSNLEAIKAATANGPLTVKGQAPLTGQLKVGYEADFIGILENPVEDVKVLQKKHNIGWVWKGGRLYKGPGVGPWGEDSES